MYNYAERTYPDSRGTIVCRAESSTLVKTFDFVTEVKCFTQKEIFSMTRSDDVEMYELEWVEFNPFHYECQNLSYYDMVELGEGFRAFPSDLANKIISYRGDLFSVIAIIHCDKADEYKLVPTQLVGEEQAKFSPFWA